MDLKTAKTKTGQAMTTTEGTGTVTDAYRYQGRTWLTVTIPGAGFNGSTLKTAIQVG